ncbi:hypothetical protein [Algisphaera agarilytica]|uniref:Uncharacterized protein n=1 Tax=Algisphaera agarilytica TaxID=1385975 RepID=A0A7X0HB60_9BACT|nr:hypothetical protein [Algisphaera agarilytica]MBB6431169.1 hypothetical protein [Algisphaera agarilytica]
MSQAQQPNLIPLARSAFAVSFEQHASPEAKVARALAGLPVFEGWCHQPTPAELESMILDLSEQELMTTAAVCLLRLAKMQSAGSPDNVDAA